MNANTDSIVLHYMLWGFDETPYRVLKNKMLVSRAPSECALCFDDIPVGARVRAQTEVYENQCKTFKVCPACCDAIIADNHDNDCLHMEHRIQLGMQQSKEKRADCR